MCTLLTLHISFPATLSDDARGDYQHQPFADSIYTLSTLTLHFYSALHCIFSQCTCKLICLYSTIKGLLKGTVLLMALYIYCTLAARWQSAHFCIHLLFIRIRQPSRYLSHSLCHFATCLHICLPSFQSILDFFCCRLCN